MGKIVDSLYAVFALEVPESLGQSLFIHGCLHRVGKGIKPGPEQADPGFLEVLIQRNPEILKNAPSIRN